MDIVRSLLDKGGEIDHTDVVSTNRLSPPSLLQDICQCHFLFKFIYIGDCQFINYPLY